MELGILGAGDMVAPTAQDLSWVDEIVVTGSRTTETHTVVPTGTIASMPDAAGQVARIPGGALVNNGGLSGQVQYRGLYGDRVLVRINGQRFQTGGPNSMDPPLHYAPMLLINSLGVDRGVSPVRNGPGLAGGVNARLKQADFAQGEVLQSNMCFLRIMLIRRCSFCRFPYKWHSDFRPYSCSHHRFDIDVLYWCRLGAHERALVTSVIGIAAPQMRNVSDT